MKIAKRILKLQMLVQSSQVIHRRNQIFFKSTLNIPYELERIKYPKKDQKLPEYFTPRQIFDILKNAANFKHKVLLLIIYSSGLRVSEVVNLIPDDIIRSKYRLRIRCGKGNKDRLTILSPLCLKYLEKYWKQYRPQIYLFNDRRIGTSMSIRAVQHAYYLARDKAGIRKQCGIHTLRHSFATHSLETGMGIFQLQKFLGHKCLKTTLRYVHLQEENIIARSPLDVYVQQYRLSKNNGQ